MAKNFLAKLPTYIAHIPEHIRTLDAIVVECLTEHYCVVYGEGERIRQKVIKETGRDITRSTLNVSVRRHRLAFLYLIGNNEERKKLREALDKAVAQFSTQVFITRPPLGGLYAVVQDKYELDALEVERLRGLKTKYQRKHSSEEKHAKALSGDMSVAKENTAFAVPSYLTKPFKVIQEAFISMQQELERQVQENNKLLNESEGQAELVKTLTATRDALQRENTELKRQCTQYGQEVVHLRLRLGKSA